MKKLILVSLLALSATLTGCMQMEMETVLDSNGAGTYAFTMSMSQDVEEALNELSAMEGGDMGDQMGDMPDFANFDKSEFEKRFKGYGVSIKSFSNKLETGKRTVSMVMSFKDFRGLQACMASFSGGEDSVVLVKLEDGNYRLEPGDSGITFEDEEEEVAEETEPSMEDMQKAMANAGKSMELMGKLMAHSSEMSVVMKVTLPSDVIEHNAHELDGRTCIWRLDSENMMSMQGMEPRITFSGKGVKIN